MGCCGDREKGDEYVKTEQRWDYINLSDFRTKSCWTPLAYGWLLLMFAVSIAIYGIDTFTAIQLIAFDRWSGQIQPAIPFSIARWIFAGCIIVSFVFLFYRWWRAIRVIKQGGVAKSYLDPLAVRVQCIRMGSEGRGYKRFLVFAELTKSRKGADYVALFSYFSFEAWLRILLAEGPRKVVNAITLYSVMQAELIPVGQHASTDGTSPFVKFWQNVGILADKNRLQAAVMLGMLFSLVVWVLAAISLAISVILYIIFLWHHIPAQDGNLSNYCRNKINRRMERIVKAKIDKALRKENDVRSKVEARAEREGYKLQTQPTLPSIATGDETHSLSGLSRQDTMTTLPEYESRPGSFNSHMDKVPPMRGPLADASRPGPKRHGTQRSDASWSSYNSNAPLMTSAGEMGMQTPMSASSAPWPTRPGPSRSMTGFSDRTLTPGPRPSTAQGGNSYQMEPLPRADYIPYGGRPGPEPGYPPTRARTPASAHPASAGVNGSYFPPMPDDRFDDRPSPGPGPPSRAFTFQDQTTRSATPMGHPPPGGPPPRSFTPQSLPPPQHHPITPFDQPTLPNIDTNVANYTGYMPPSSRSGTPSSVHPLSRLNANSDANLNPFPPQPQPASQPPMPEYRSFHRPRAPPSYRNGDGARDSGVDDILNHY